MQILELEHNLFYSMEHYTRTHVIVKKPLKRHLDYLTM